MPETLIKILVGLAVGLFFCASLVAVLVMIILC